MEQVCAITMSKKKEKKNSVSFINIRSAHTSIFKVDDRIIIYISKLD